MNIEELRDYCLALPGTTEGFPFGEQTLVFKIGGKIYLLTSLDAAQLQFNVKCNPTRAVELREEYGCVLPGYHMNKDHWNTIVVDGSVSEVTLRSWISDSYSLVLASLPVKFRAELAR